MKHSLIVLILCSITGIAQSRNPNEILESCGKAMGARQEVDLVAEGDLHMANSDSTEHVLIKTRGLESFRMERGMPGDVRVSIISRGRGVHRDSRGREKLSRQTTAYFKADHLPALVCGINLGKLGLRITYEGEEVLGSRRAFHLKLDAAPKGKDTSSDAVESLISEYHIFIDQESFTVLKTARLLFSANALENRSWWESRYSDYRSVGGILMPFRVENFLSNQPISTTVFTHISTDTSLSDQEFQEEK